MVSDIAAQANCDSAPSGQGRNSTHSVVESLTILLWTPTLPGKYCVPFVFIPGLIVLFTNQKQLFSSSYSDPLAHLQLREFCPSSLSQM